MPGSRIAHATGLPSACSGFARPTSDFAWVVRTIELVMAVVALGRISTFSGVKLHEDWSGKPEHDSVTNIGAVSVLAFTGVTETVTEPD